MALYTTEKFLQEFYNLEVATLVMTNVIPMEFDLGPTKFAILMCHI